MTTRNIFDLTDTWNNVATVFNAIKMNVTDTASHADSKILDLLKAGVSQFAVDKNGNVTLLGTVDTRDIATDGAKLDSIEAAADVTDATNVAATGAVMDGDFSGSEGIMRKTGAGTYTVVKTNLVATSNPLVTSDAAAGYGIASIWVNLTSDEAFMCLDATNGAAVWQSLTASGGMADLSDDTTPELGGNLVTGAFTVDGRDPSVDGAKLDGVETAADVTDAANVDAAGAVMESDFNADTILAANADNTPLPLAVAASRFLGRKSTGNIAAMTAAEARTILNVEDGSEITSAAKVGAAGAVMDSDFSGSEGIMRKTGAGAYVVIKTNLNASTNPLVTSDAAAGYSVGSIWINTTADTAYVCLDTTNGAAVWTEITAGAGGGIANVVEDATPELGGNLDTNGNSIISTGGANIVITPDGAGRVQIDGNNFPDNQGANGQVIQGNGSGNLIFANAVMDSDFTATEGFMRKTAAGTYTVVKSNLAATTAPGVSDDGVAGYGIGSVWIDTTGDKSYLCVDASTGAAVWNDLTASTAVNDAEYLVLTLNPTLTNERRLVGGTGVDIADGGANGDATLSVSLNELPTDATGGATSDFVPIVDASGGNASEKVLISDFKTNAGIESTGHSHTLADVTDSGALAAKGTVATGDIDNDAVTLAKMANMATASFLGRNTAATGDPEVLSAAVARGILNVADGANNYSHPNHTGDVTSTGDGATVIANNAVTLAKMADMATASFIGRNTAATGDPEVLSAATARGILNVSDGANNYSHPNHTGDVTSTGDGATVIANNAVTTAKIADENVTLPKLAHIATDSFLGRDTAATGDVEVLSAAAARGILNVSDGANNYSHPNHTGDVTSTGDGATAIAARAVTVAKMLAIDSQIFLGRNTAGTGDIESLNKATALSMLNVEDGADVTDAANVNSAGAVMHSDVSGTNAGSLIRTGSETYSLLQHNLAATVAPTTTDDTGSGYAVGSLWIDTTGDKSYICVDATTSAAVWNDLTAGGGGGDLWSDVVNANIIPDADGTRNIGATGTRFANGFFDALSVGGNITVSDGSEVKIGSTTVLEYGSGTSGTRVKIEPGASGTGPLIYINGGGVNEHMRFASKGTGEFQFDSDLNITGDIIVSGNVDGRDVGVDGGKLDGIETAADVTDATNVAAAGAIMDSDISGSNAGAMIRTGAGAYSLLQHNLSATTAPVGTDDSGSGYAVGSLWIDTTGDKSYVCVDATVSSAVWNDLTAGGGATQLNELSDVNTSGVTNRNVLVADGVDFESRALVEADISDFGTYNNYSHPNHTGDVTSTGDGATVIANSAVTLAKMADMATDSFLGRDTAGSGAPEVLSPATARTLLNVADGANNYSHPNHTGDVTSTGDGATVIADEAVTLAKMAHMATNSFLGRDTAGTGDVEVMSVATSLSVLGLTNAAKLDVADQTITGGANVTILDQGNKSTAYTLDYGARPMQRVTNASGTWALNPDTAHGSIILFVENDGAPGTITTTNWDAVTGDPFTNTANHDFICYATTSSDGSVDHSHLHVVAMQ